MADVWACYPRAICHIAGCCHRANSMTCHPRDTCHVAGSRLASTWWIHSRDPRATCHIAGCSHLAKSMLWSAILQGVRNESRCFRHILFYFFLMQFGLWRAAAFVSSPIHLLTSYSTTLVKHLHFHCVSCLKIHSNSLCSIYILQMKTQINFQ